MTLITTKRRKNLFPETMEDFFNDRFFDNLPFIALPKRNGPFIPDVNIIENPDSYQIELATPGLERKDFKIEIQNGILNISAEKEEENQEEGKNFRRREFSFNSFSRSFSLPVNMNTDKIDAKYDNGVLQLTLPKEEISPVEPVKQIQIG